MTGVLGHSSGGLVSLVGTAVESDHECALLQIGTHPDMTLDVARTKTTTNNKYSVPHCDLAATHLLLVVVASLLLARFLCAQDTEPFLLASRLQLLPQLHGLHLLFAPLLDL